MASLLRRIFEFNRARESKALEQDPTCQTPSNNSSIEHLEATLPRLTGISRPATLSQAKTSDGSVARQSSEPRDGKIYGRFSGQEIELITPF